MRLLPENKKKQWIYIAVIVLCLGATIWMWVGMGSKKVGDLLTKDVPAADVLPGGEGALPGGIKSELPFGPKINVSLFSDPRFQALHAPQRLIVIPEELGRDNPFAAPTATPPPTETPE